MAGSGLLSIQIENDFASFYKRIHLIRIEQDEFVPRVLTQSV